MSRNALSCGTDSMRSTGSTSHSRRSHLMALAPDPCDRRSRSAGVVDPRVQPAVTRARMASRPCGERQTSPWDAATEITSLMGLAAASRSRLTSRPGYASGGGSFVCPLRWEHREPTSIDDLEQMDTAQLRALVARGRQRRWRSSRRTRSAIQRPIPRRPQCRSPCPRAGRAPPGEAAVC
jgi:hypothetical protein